MSSEPRQRVMFGVVLLALVVAGALYVLQPWNPSSSPSTSSSSDSASSTTSEGAPATTAAVLRPAETGKPNAPVTVEEYSDFQCSICRRYVTTLKDQIDQTFVDSGQVRVVFHHFIRYGEESVLAAQAAECAGEQGKFWDYHRTLYEEQEGINQGAFNRDSLMAFAERLALDTQAFASCVDSGRYIAKIEADTEKGRGLGIRSTPGFVINGKLVGNITSIEGFQQLVNQALGENLLRENEG